MFTSSGVVTAARWLETGQVPESVRLLQEVVEQTMFYRLVRSDIDALLDQDSQESEAIKQILHRVKQTLFEDLEKVREVTVSIPQVQRTLRWIMRNMNSVSS